MFSVLVCSVCLGGACFFIRKVGEWVIGIPRTWDSPDIPNKFSTTIICTKNSPGGPREALLPWENISGLLFLFIVFPYSVIPTVALLVNLGVLMNVSDLVFHLHFLNFPRRTLMTLVAKSVFSFHAPFDIRIAWVWVSDVIVISRVLSIFCVCSLNLGHIKNMRSIFSFSSMQVGLSGKSSYANLHKYVRKLLRFKSNNSWHLHGYGWPILTLGLLSGESIFPCHPINPATVDPSLSLFYLGLFWNLLRFIPRLIQGPPCFCQYISISITLTITKADSLNTVRNSLAFNNAFWWPICSSVNLVAPCPNIDTIRQDRHNDMSEELFVSVS